MTANPLPAVPLTVRPVASGDLGALSLIWLETMEILAQADPRIQMMHYANVEWVKAAQVWLDDPHFALFIAERRDTPVAYLVVEDRPNVAGLLPERYGMIHELYADSHGRGEGGVGRVLLDQARMWLLARGIRQLRADIPKQHAIAQAFWRASGAKPVAEQFILKL